MRKASSRREREKRIVLQMIRLYCRKKHGCSDLCEECAALADYAAQRSGHCSFGENKTFCSNCKVHCYQPKMRESIRKVMRFSGPRMLFYHPALTLCHLTESRREKARQEENK